MGLLAVFILFFGLLQSMFDLELFELIVFVLVLWGVNFLASTVVALF